MKKYLRLQVKHKMNVKHVRNLEEICQTTLPRASNFNESVAMDLKFIHSKIILHIIDHFTRYSTACLIPLKRKEVIINSVLKSWIAIF